jgi:hypothetical protein
MICSSKAHCEITDSFGCQAHAKPAETDVQGLFRRAGTKKPIEVTVAFKDRQVDCTGVPLQLNVMNGQLIHVSVLPPDGFACVTTETRAPAQANLSPDDIIGIITKMNGLGFVEGIPSTPLTFYLDSGKNVALTASVSCKSGTRTLKQDVTVTYQNPFPLAVSAGFLLGTSTIRSYGIATKQIGTASGVAATQNTIAVTGSSDVQVIPFSYFNFYWSGSKVLSLNGQFGIGVNPNLSTPRVEYFGSPLALAWHDLYLSPGFHLGEHESLTGGFTIGENTAASLSKVPQRWTHYTGFGFSVSYNLKPLVKGSNTLTSSKK